MNLSRALTHHMWHFFCLSLFLCAGCTVPWGVKTTYVIKDMREEAQLKLSDELRDYGFTELENGATFRFTLSEEEVKDMATLKGIQVVIQEVSEDTKLPVVLKEVTMVFESVSGEGESSISVSGTATAGSQIILDIGVRRALTLEVDDNGKWQDVIQSNSRLSQRGGWIYGVITKEGAKQYMKMNVLDTEESQRILREELPLDSILRDY